MIFVDAATGSKDLVGPLRKAGLSVELAHLSTADVEFAGRGVGGEPVLIGIECKRLSEITGDWDRLCGEQVPKMQAPTYDHRWVVVEGPWHVDPQSGRLQRRGRRGDLKPMHGLSSASLVRKRLLTLELCGGFHLLYTKDRAETVAVLADLYRWWTDEDFDQHKSHIVTYHPTGLTPLSPTAFALSAWPGLSTVRAKAAAAHFKTLRRAVNATPAQWAEMSTRDKSGTARKFGAAGADTVQKLLDGKLDG